MFYTSAVIHSVSHTSKFIFAISDSAKITKTRDFQPFKVFYKIKIDTCARTVVN